ncbi:MAG: glutamine synthetase [Nitrospirae bacterium]|nr:glutamine synthetase [Nitrospirota bacterium]
MEKLRDKKDVIEFVEKNNVKFIRLWFTDILGQLKSFAITSEELDTAFDEGMGFDGSSIKGYARIDESDMIAKPDPSTFQILPWRPKEKAVARMFCDVLNPDGTPYEGDPRYALRRNLQRLKEHGFTLYLGPELEFFYFDAEASVMADSVMTYRIVVKEIASKYGCFATFMPKPIFGQNGSGMHTHQSLFKGDRNAFFDPKDKYYLSDIAKKYIAGLLRHAPEITAVCNQWVNSYKRLVPGYEAPVYIAWARRNRSALVRVPLYKPGKEKATRIELRSPDPSCNPYLAFSVMLAAGLEGIEKNYELPEPVEKDIYHLTEEEKHQLGIKSLPGSLIEAIEIAEKSDVVRKALGDHIFNNFIENKKIEWDNYRIKIHPYEIERYLPIL